MKDAIETKLMNQINSCGNIIRRKKQKGKHHPQGYGRILAAVYKNEDASQSELADILDIRPQSLTRVLLTLEKEGHITRQRSEDDRRSLIVKITEKGIRRYEELSKIRGDRAKRVFDCLDADQKKQLSDLLQAVIEGNSGKEAGK